MGITMLNPHRLNPQHWLASLYPLTIGYSSGIYNTKIRISLSLKLSQEMLELMKFDKDVQNLGQNPDQLFLDLRSVILIYIYPGQLRG